MKQKSSYRSRKWICLLLLIPICWTNAGCDLTLGPKVKTRYVIVKPGKPLRVLENKVVKVRVLKGEGDPIAQDVGGWVAMPEEHWDAVKRKINEGAP